MCISFDAGRICLGPRRRFHFRMNFSVRKGCNICRIVRVSHYSENAYNYNSPALTPCFGVVLVSEAADICQKWKFFSFSFRRHPQTCDSMQSSRFPSSRTSADTAARHFQALCPSPQTSADICPERFQSPQTSADIRRHPQTFADNEFSQLRNICDAIIQLLLRHP